MRWFLVSYHLEFWEMHVFNSSSWRSYFLYFWFFFLFSCLLSTLLVRFDFFQISCLDLVGYYSFYFVFWHCHCFLFFFKSHSKAYKDCSKACKHERIRTHKSKRINNYKNYINLVIDSFTEKQNTNTLKRRVRKRAMGVAREHLCVRKRSRVGGASMRAFGRAYQFIERITHRDNATEMLVITIIHVDLPLSLPGRHSRRWRR